MNIIIKKFNTFYNSKYFNLILFTVFFVIPFIIYYKLIVNNMSPVSGDGIAEFSMKLFLNSAIKDGELPLWNPYLANGVPYAGNLNGAFYPISIILSILPIKWFIYCFYSLHLAFGAFFTYLYLKEINCNKFIAICTSFIYLFSIHLGGFRKEHMSIIIAVVYMPIILYFIEKYIKSGRIKFLIASSCTMAIAVISGGHIQPMVYTDIVVMIYFFYRMLSIKFSLRKVLCNLILWGIIFLGIASIQLLPTLELISNYRAAGAGDTFYETFLVYSIHPIKLIMMLLPNAFGKDVYEHLGYKYSSGFDIEIFLGIGVFLIILFGLKNYFKDCRVKALTFFMCGVFIFAANAHIPFLSKILYHIPVLGGFRCPSRILFAFIFFGYALFAIILTKIKEEMELQKLYIFVTRFGIFMCSILIVMIPFISILSSGLTSDELLARYSSLKLAFMKPIIIIITIAVVLKILNHIQLKRSIISKWTYNIISIVVLIITVIETAPFSMVSNATSMNEFGITDSAEQNIKDNIGNNKIWEDNVYPGASSGNIINSNSNVIKEIPAINAYIPFNNPHLSKLFTDENIMKPLYNATGLLSYFPEANNNLINQNDLLSMLGVKYIMDPQSYITGNENIITTKVEKALVYEKKSIKIPSQNGELFVFNDIINVEPNTNYKISFTANADQVPSLFYADFYGGPEYDNELQNPYFAIAVGKNEYEALINTDNCDISNEIYLRFVTNSLSDIDISNVKVSKMHIETETNVYVPYYIDEENRVFENTNAKDILYTPSSVVGISDVEDIYNNVSNYDLDDVSYVENMEDFTVADTIINNIVWKRNSITANVSADDSTFINFSQNYYPGWNAYIDGKKTELYMVNGLIQGIKVPEGEHKIIFRYIPTTLIIGVFILFVTILVSILLIKRDKKTSN